MTRELFDDDPVAADDALIDSLLDGSADTNDPDPVISGLAAVRAHVAYDDTAQEAASAPGAHRAPPKMPRRAAAVVAAAGLMITGGVGQAVAGSPVAPLLFVVDQGISIGQRLATPEGDRTGAISRGKVSEAPQRADGSPPAEPYDDDADGSGATSPDDSTRDNGTGGGDVGGSSGDDRRAPENGSQRAAGEPGIQQSRPDDQPRSDPQRDLAERDDGSPQEQEEGSSDLAPEQESPQQPNGESTPPSDEPSEGESTDPSEGQTPDPSEGQTPDPSDEPSDGESTEPSEGQRTEPSSDPSSSTRSNLRPQQDDRNDGATVDGQ